MNGLEAMNKNDGELEWEQFEPDEQNVLKVRKKLEVSLEPLSSEIELLGLNCWVSFSPL
jgi:hypothetical protein